MNNYQYELILYWSTQDNAFVIDVPELPGCAAHGDSHQEVLENIYQAMDLWIDAAREFVDPVPTVKGRRLMVA